MKCEPHSLQSARASGFPLSAEVSVNMLGLVLLVYRSMEGDSMRLDEKAEPVYFLQLMQWQTATCNQNNNIPVSL